MDWSAIAQWSGFLVLASGLGYSFWRNGTVARKALDDRITKTEKAILKEISSMKEVWAGDRATFKTRLDNHDRELKELKKP